MLEFLRPTKTTIVTTLFGMATPITIPTTTTMTATIPITTITMMAPLPKSVSQGSDRYNKITLIDNINLLPTPHREDQDIVILGVTEKEIEKAFPELVFKKKCKKNKRENRKRKHAPIIQSHSHQN